MTEPTKTDALPLRLALDASGRRAQANLRIGAACIAVIAGIWLAWVEGRWWLRLTALASVLFGMRWLSLARASRAARKDDADYLEITGDELVLATGLEVRRLPLDSIRAVELDHDRLTVMLRLENGEELAIEPQYGGLGLRELGETIERILWARAHRDAQG
jgi:hypothetical protein